MRYRLKDSREIIGQWRDNLIDSLDEEELPDEKNFIERLMKASALEGLGRAAEELIERGHEDAAFEILRCMAEEMMKV